MQRRRMLEPFATRLPRVAEPITHPDRQQRPPTLFESSPGAPHSTMSTKNAPLSCSDLIDTPDTLQQSFRQLNGDQLDIQGLFGLVATQLKQCDKIGNGHPLSKEWDALRKKHLDVYRNSQKDAKSCAVFLRNYKLILVPLSQSPLSQEDKMLMVEEFLKVIPEHVSNARKNSEQFNDLMVKIEEFSEKLSKKVTAVHSHENENLWTKLANFCKSIWRGLMSFASKVLNAFRAVLSWTGGKRMSDICVGGKRTSGTTTAAERSRAVANTIKEDCQDLRKSIALFERPWRTVEMSCVELMDTIKEDLVEGPWHTVEMSCVELMVSARSAKDLASIPVVSELILDQTQVTYITLMCYLDAYSLGTAPEF